MRPTDLADLPPPREVRGGPGGAIWFQRLFILPHTLVGLGSILVVLYGVLWALLATERPGVVRRAYTSSSKGHTSYYVDYDYRVGDELRHGTGAVGAERYQELEPTTRPGATPGEVRVRYFGPGPLGHAELAETRGAVWLALLFPLLWAGFWNAVVGVFLYQLWVVPYRTRQLYRLGLPARGRLTGKRSVRGRGVHYYVAYEYEPAGGRVLRGEMRVQRKEDWEAAAEGREVAVLYWPERPERSVVYALGGYTVVGERT